MTQAVPCGDDAVLEVELSPQDLLALTQTRTRRPEKVTAKLATGASRYSPRVTIALGAVATVAAIAALFIAYRVPDTKPPVLAAAAPSAPAAIELPPALPVPVSSPVRFANPFDRTEVFEFPAGTSRAQAREKVAEILARRAQERAPTLRRAARTARRYPAA